MVGSQFHPQSPSPVMMAWPSGVKSTAAQVRLGIVSRSSSLPVSACHTRTSLWLLVANSSEDSLKVKGRRGWPTAAEGEGLVGTHNGKAMSVMEL